MLKKDQPFIIEKNNFKENYRIASIRAKQMIENGLYSRFNENTKQRIKNATIGCLGEIMFEQFLKNNDIPYELDQTDFTVSSTDEFDFKINDKIIDVKVAKTNKVPQHSWTFGYPVDQHPETKDYIVIGWVNVEKEEVGFYGFIEGEKVKNKPIVEKNSFAKFDYKTPNHEFSWGELSQDFNKLFNINGGK